MPGAKWGGLPASFACLSFFPHIVHPTDADGPPCGVPAPQGISSLTSGNGLETRGQAPAPPPPPSHQTGGCTDPVWPASNPTAVPRPRGKLAGLLRTFMRSRPSRQRLRQRGILRQRVFGCDLGEHLSNSGQDGEAQAHLPSPPFPPGIQSPNPDPTVFSQCPRCFAAALSLLRPMGWWMESTGSQACHPISRGYGEGLPPTPSLHKHLLSIFSPGPVPCAGDTEFLGVRRA